MEKKRNRDNHKWKRVMGGDLPSTKKEKIRAQKNEMTMKLPSFVKACEAVGIPPKRRQASKWNRKMGKAYTVGRQLI